MTPNQMREAMAGGCPPEVAAHSRFPRAMDRTWVRLWGGLEFVVPHGLEVRTINLAHLCHEYGDPDLMPPVTGGEPGVFVSHRSLPMTHVFRSWWEGECTGCGRLFCGRIRFA